MQTAEEFLNDLEIKFQKSGRPFFYKDALKEFAKLHVKAALEAAGNDISEGPWDAMKACIIESYPLTNIK